MELVWLAQMHNIHLNFIDLQEQCKVGGVVARADGRVLMGGDDLTAIRGPTSSILWPERMFNQQNQQPSM